MNTSEILAEIAGLRLYSPAEWQEYIDSFRPEDRPDEALMARRNGEALRTRVASCRGRMANLSAGVSRKVVSLEDLRDIRHRTKVTLGIVSGSYDLLHLGHLREMVAARKYMEGLPCPVLCALVLGDEAIQSKKGEARPVLDVNERVGMLAAVQCLDYVVVLMEPDCMSAIDSLRPELFFKSPRDDSQPVVREEKALVELSGGRAVDSLASGSGGVSTSSLVDRIYTMANPVDHTSLGFQSAEMLQFPNIVNVEVCRGRCPCRCVHCPVGSTHPRSRRRRFGRKDMGLSLFGRIVEETARHSWSSIRIHAVGEPLCWPGIRDAAQIVRERGVTSWLFTSGITKDRALLDTLCESLRIIEVSVNSISRDDYTITKGVDAFDLVTGNIEYMSKRIQSSAIPCSLIVSRVQSSCEAADQEFVSHWKATGLVSDAFVRSYHTYNDLMPGRQSGDSPALHEPCLVHWARFNVAADGRAVVCFNELFKPRIDPNLVLGDLRTESIADIWRGPKLSALRQAELSGDYSGLPFADALPCRTCAYCQPLRGNRTTSEYQLMRVAVGRQGRDNAESL